MKVIVDTNVIISGIFFKGKPGQIIDLWKNGNISFITNKEIITEYINVCNELSFKLKSGNINSIINLILFNTELVDSIKLEEQISEDRDDDKFIGCAIVSGVKIIISGDKHLLKVNGTFNLEILKPENFLKKYFPF